MAKKGRDRFKGIEQSESGDYEYTGELFRLREDAGGGVRRRLILVLAAICVTVVVSGLSEAEAATRAFYVILPYVGEVTSLFILLWGAASVLRNKDEVRGTVLERSRGRIIGAATLTSLFACIGCLASVLYIALNGMGADMVQSVSYPVIKLATALLAYYFRNCFLAAGWDRIR